MVFIYHSIFTNAHKSYIYKVINKNLEEYIQYCFHLICKVRITELLGLIFYLYFRSIWVSHKILTKKDVTFIIWGKQRYYYCFERKKVEILNYNYLLKVCKN